MASRKPRRSAFDDQSQGDSSPAAGGTPLMPDGSSPTQSVDDVLSPLPGGLRGLNVATTTRRARGWEREHQYGQGYSVKGVKPEVNAWLSDMAKELGVRVSEVAVYALSHSMALVESGGLEVALHPAANSASRGALYTLLPPPDEQGSPRGQGSPDDHISHERGETKKKKKEGKKKKPQDEWKKKVTNWNPFDRALKETVSSFCLSRRLLQGEFISFLLERARQDYWDGKLVFAPRPKSPRENKPR